MRALASARTQRKSKPNNAIVIGDKGELQEKVGYMMGKLEGIETRLDQNDQQRDRMEGKIDHLPELMREVVRPVIDTQNDHGARLSALEKADAVENSKISMRTKIAAGIATATGLIFSAWEAFSK